MTLSGKLRRFVGIDLAWKTTNRTGLAVVNDEGGLVSSGVVKSDGEIAAWLGTHAPTPTIVAVDAPLVVPNATGQRVAENLIGKAYGRFGASAYPANRANPLFDPPRAEQLAHRHGWSVDPNTPPGKGRAVCIEVYPHPALVGLFELPQRILYKKGSDRKAGFLELAACLQSVPELQLDESGRWAELLQVIASPGRGDLTRIEDELDAILCAHLAWLWYHRPGALEVYGSSEEGYIVAPPAPTHRATEFASRPATKSAPSHDVLTLEVWGIQPGTFATARGKAWREALMAAAAHHAEFSPGKRLSLEVEYVLPARLTSRDEWDLDNLLKPTIDGLTTILGARAGDWKSVQANDERIDRIVATKRAASDGEQYGARLVIGEWPR